jgi:cellulose synthase/poly-beta-1,6-N-acetylglucosamine synthase-like glycosyltransferase
MNLVSIIMVYMSVIVGLTTLWSAYHFPIILYGLRMRKRRARPELLPDGRLPFLSVLIPARDEERVLTRPHNIVESLLRADYPKDKLEVILAVSATQDRTLEVAREYERRHPGLIRVVEVEPRGKPWALNRALGLSRGEVIAVFDADDYVEPDALRVAVSRLITSGAAAVQGWVAPFESGKGLIARVTALEDRAWNYTIAEGRSALNLYTPFRGTNLFIWKWVLLKEGGWDAESLSEDAELGVRLYNRGYRVAYEPAAKSYEEPVSSLGVMFRQRIRWFRGTCEVALRYGRLLRRPTLKRLDAELATIYPILMALTFITYALVVLSYLFPDLTPPSPLNPLLGFTLFTLLGILPIGLVLVFALKPRSLKNLLWIPFIYGYWILLTAIANLALLHIVFRRPKEWYRTQKTGIPPPVAYSHQGSSLNLSRG